MNVVLRVAALVITVAVAWLAAREVPVAARLWTVCLVTLLPPLSIAQARMLASSDSPPRRALYLSSALSLWALAALTALAAGAAGYGPRDLGLVLIGPVATALWVVGLTAAGVGLVQLSRLAGVKESPTLRKLLPQENSDRVLFAGLSVSAGVCEEIVFRGFLIAALAQAVGSAPLAAIVAAAVFGLLHAYQGAAGAARAGALGLLLATPLLAIGSIVPAILAHTAIDLIGGLVIGRDLID